jgi:ribosomal-protein-alanine N-acetyltransferase
MRVEIKKIDSYHQWPSRWAVSDYVLWLHHWLAPFTDDPEAIQEALNYALKSPQGGAVFFGEENGELVSTAVVNRTGMAKYIPENILVYLAVSPPYRNRGYGRELCAAVLEAFPGDFALHVEYENPAVRLYQRLGFQSKYAEMRRKR